MPKKHATEAAVRTPDRMAQRDMHKSFFDRCRYAIDNGFYMEAILMEYAAIEARLEVILGIIGLPCNQFLPDDARRKVCISHRVACLKKIRKTHSVFEKSKLPKNYFDSLEKWIKTRNGYIHGLYKNEVRFKTRMKDSKETAEKGLELCKQLYNEANRIRRLSKKSESISWCQIRCYTTDCKLFSENRDVKEV